MEQWIQNQGLRHLSFCILAAQACRSNVDEVDEQERQRLVDAKAESLASKNDEEVDASIQES